MLVFIKVTPDDASESHRHVQAAFPGSPGARAGSAGEGGMEAALPTRHR